MATGNLVDICWICGSAISLQMYTFDLQGRPVHGPCLTAMSALGERIKPSKAGKRPLVFVSGGHGEKVLS